MKSSLTESRDVDFINDDFARDRSDEPRYQSEHRTLARTAAAQDHGDLAARKTAASTAEYFAIAETHGYVVEEDVGVVAFGGGAHG